MKQSAFSKRPVSHMAISVQKCYNTVKILQFIPIIPTYLQVRNYNFTEREVASF